MTTYTLQGIGVDFAEVGDLAEGFIPSVTLEFTILNGAPVFSYTVISSIPGDLDEVQINSPAINSNINGISILPENPLDETYFVAVEWDDGGVTRTTYIVDLFVESTDFDYLFVVGGDAFPTFATMTDFNNFLINDAISFNDVTSGPFAPNTDISIPGIPGVSVSENDTVFGTAGNDTITPGENDGFDQLFGSTGNDEYIFTGVVGSNSYYELNYSNLGNGIVLTVNGSTNIGSVNKGVSGIDTITDVAAPLNTGWFNGGIKWVGTAFNDVFDITTGTDQWNQVSGGAGNDTFNITRNGSGLTRIDYSGAAAGINVNLSTGVVSDDGDGGMDTINGFAREIRGSNFADVIVGSANDESFIGRTGNDIIDGGDGFDRIRYDRSGVDAGVNVNLTTGTASGSWSGQAFTHSLSNIEWVRGSGFNDVFTGSLEDETFDGRSGSDQVIFAGSISSYTISRNYENNSIIVTSSTPGVDGTDTLFGIEELIFSDDVLFDFEIGGDTSVFGTSGNDINLTGLNVAYEFIYGLEGNDTILAFNDDIVVGGEGDDTIIGVAPTVGQLEADEFVTLDYATEAFRGGFQGINANLTTGIVIDTHGDTDTVSNIDRIYGTNFNDTIVGDDSDFQMFDPHGGVDTIDGAGGFDELAYHLSEGVGGTGAITVTFSNVTAGSGTATDPWGDTDTFQNIEGIRATRFNDTLTGGLGDQRFRGLDGADVIDGGAGVDYADYRRDAQYGGADGITVDLTDLDINGFGLVIDGFGSHDRVFDIERFSGTAFSDSMTGDANDNTFNGEAGDDTLTGGAGADDLDGGAGVDTAVYSNSSSAVNVDLTTGMGTGGTAQGDTLSEIENLIGSDHNDTLTADGGDNVLIGGAGADALNGGGGTDTASYLGSSVGVSIYLASGSTFNGDAVGDTFTSIEGVAGSDHQDFLFGDVGINQIDGNAGDDWLYGGDNNDTLNGGAGSDLIFGEQGIDIINGGDDGDFIWGGSEGDTIHGNDGIDWLRGEAGIDFLFGDAGDDILIGGTGNDQMTGGTGTDTFFGEVGNDIINGEANGDVAFGQDGDDIINGGSEGDFLFGGIGADTINGGTENDLMWGNLPGIADGDQDTFIFNANWGFDAVYDFELGVDQISIEGIAGATQFSDLTVFDGGANVTLAFGADAFTLYGVTLAELNANTTDFVFS